MLLSCVCVYVVASCTRRHPQLVGICAQAKGFPEFAARFAKDGVDGDCVVGLKTSQLRVLQRLCHGVQSTRSVSELMQVIQEYRSDGVTYGVHWQTNPLVSHEYDRAGGLLFFITLITFSQLSLVFCVATISECVVALRACDTDSASETGLPLLAANVVTIIASCEGIVLGFAGAWVAAKI